MRQGCRSLALVQPEPTEGYADQIFSARANLDVRRNHVIGLTSYFQTFEVGLYCAPLVGFLICCHAIDDGGLTSTPPGDQKQRTSPSAWARRNRARASRATAAPRN